MADQEYCLRWNNHQSTLTEIFDKLLKASRYTDCTISAGGQNVAAHKILLTACSPYFDNLFSGIRDDRHAVIVLSDVSYTELRALMDYMYKGEVNISQDRLSGLLKVAEALQIRGLYEVGETQPHAPPPKVPPSTPTVSGNRTPSGLSIERTRRSTQLTASVLDLPLVTSTPRDDTASPAAKRRKRPGNRSSLEDLAPAIAEPLPDAKVQAAGFTVTPIKPVIDETAVLLDPPMLKSEPVYEVLQPKEEMIDDHEHSIEDITLDDDDDDDGMDDTDRSQQPGTSYMQEGSSSQGYPPSWNNSEQSNDEVFMAAQQAAGDGTLQEGSPPKAEPGENVGYFRGKLVEKPFKCGKCKKSYQLRYTLNRHLKHECGQEAKFYCPHCDYKSKRKEHLVNHYRNRHAFLDAREWQEQAPEDLAESVLGHPR